MQGAIRSMGLVLVLGLALSGPVAAEPYEDARAAYEKGDYATAFRLYLPLAENGNAVAQHALGEMYRDGRGVGQDYVQAANWMRTAADQGYTVSQLALGKFYYLGQGVPEDHVQAGKWLTLADQRGLPDAHVILELLAQKMARPRIDEAITLAWEWRANWGETEAQATLGYYYYIGRGVPKDHVQAFKWYSLAAAKGHGGGEQYRDNLAKELTPAQIAEAQKLAAEWKTTKPEWLVRLNAP